MRTTSQPARSSSAQVLVYVHGALGPFVSTLLGSDLDKVGRVISLLVPSRPLIQTFTLCSTARTVTFSFFTSAAFMDILLAVNAVNLRPSLIANLPWMRLTPLSAEDSHSLFYPADRPRVSVS